MESFDCVVCGELCVDLPIRTIDRRMPLAEQGLVRTDPILPGSGGIVANSGMVLARLGLRTAAIGCLGSDPWAEILTRRLLEHGVATQHLLRCTDAATSVTAVMVDEDGEHTFAYHAGASARLSQRQLLANLPLFEKSRFALFGYYGLFPSQLQAELPHVLRRIRQTGCKTALDAGGDGGELRPLDELLPHLDLYIPSYQEARRQTQQSEPRDMLAEFRRYCPHGLLGIKLGAAGALLSTPGGELVQVEAIEPPGPVVDTTGAGDSFYAGLIAGLVHGLPVKEAARVAAAAGACCVTEVGTITAIRGFAETCRLAGVEAC